MAFEYQESDVIFSEQEPKGCCSTNSYYIWPAQLQQLSFGDGRRGVNKMKKMRGDHSSSLPISIPEVDHFHEELEEWEGGGGIVPPHLIVSRRRCVGKIEFSVCYGKGRTLKGRDLKKVRNEILTMTGFLEA